MDRQQLRANLNYHQGCSDAVAERSRDSNDYTTGTWRPHHGLGQGGCTGVSEKENGPKKDK